MRVHVSPKGRYYKMIDPGIGLVYAEKGGGPVLRWETSWRKLSGFVVNTRWGCVWVQLRRVSKW